MQDERALRTELADEAELRHLAKARRGSTYQRWI